jgi:ABC-2 type transport system ATP-binding protein
MCPDADRATAALARLTGSGVRVADFSLGQPSLDEVFLALTGHPAEEAPTEPFDKRDKERTP